MENVIVIVVVAIALCWGLVSVVRSVRQVKKVGEAPITDDGCATGEQSAAELAPGCGCTTSGSCPVSDKCAVPTPAEVTEATHKAD